jgi:hypothetical protein
MELIELLLILTASALTAYGRHIQDSAGRRWKAIVIYVVALLPVIIFYLVQSYILDLSPASAAVSAVLVGITISFFFLHLTFREYFGSNEPHWVVILRYGVSYLVLAVLTLFWPAVIAVPLMWGATWLASKPSSRINNPHSIWEWFHGALAGLFWSAGIIFLV